jgi:hypothetical protein
MKVYAQHRFDNRNIYDLIPWYGTEESMIWNMWVVAFGEERISVRLRMLGTLAEVDDYVKDPWLSFKVRLR